MSIRERTVIQPWEMFLVRDYCPVSLEMIRNLSTTSLKVYAYLYMVGPGGELPFKSIQQALKQRNMISIAKAVVELECNDWIRIQRVFGANEYERRSNKYWITRGPGAVHIKDLPDELRIDYVPPDRGTRYQAPGVQEVPREDLTPEELFELQLIEEEEETWDVIS